MLQPVGGWVSGQRGTIIPVLWVLLAIVVVAGIAVVAAGRGTGLEPAATDRPGPWLPADRSMRPEDLDAVRFSVVVRGYRMDEVDAVLDRLRAELADRDRRIADLERHGPVGRSLLVPLVGEGTEAPEGDGGA